jgi:hypothetical protein
MEESSFWEANYFSSIEIIPHVLWVCGLFDDTVNIILPNDLLPSHFPTETLYTFLVSRTDVSDTVLCHTQLLQESRACCGKFAATNYASLRHFSFVYIPSKYAQWLLPLPWQPWSRNCRLWQLLYEFQTIHSISNISVAKLQYWGSAVLNHKGAQWSVKE